MNHVTKSHHVFFSPARGDGSTRDIWTNQQLETVADPTKPEPVDMCAGSQTFDEIFKSFRLALSLATTKLNPPTDLPIAIAPTINSLDEFCTLAIPRNRHLDDIYLLKAILANTNRGTGGKFKAELSTAGKIRSGHVPLGKTPVVRAWGLLWFT